MTTVAGTIVVGVDGTSGSDLAVDWAAEVAARDHRALTIAHAAGSADDASDAKTTQAARRRALAYLAPDRVHVVNRTGGPREALCQLSEGARMLVVGSRKRLPVASRFLGSVGASLAAQAACPVVVVRWGAEPVDESAAIVVGVDGSSTSQAALEFAFDQASRQGRTLWILHAYWGSVAGANALEESVAFNRELAGERLAIAESVAGLSEKYVDVQMVLEPVMGPAVAALVTASQDAALVVVGSRSRRDVAAIVLGSVSRSLLERSACPVAVVRTFGP